MPVHDDKAKRVGGVVASNGGTIPEGTTFPKNNDKYITHEVGEDWVCSDCTHNISVHGMSSGTEVQRDTVTNAVHARASLPKYPRKDFFAMKMGIIETPSERSVSTDAKERVKRNCGHKCVVTGLCDALKVVHVVQQEIVYRSDLMAMFDLEAGDVDADSNLICLTSVLEEALNNNDFCFFPG